MEEGAKRLKEPEIADDHKEIEFSRHVVHYSYELIIMLTSCSNPTQVQTREDPSIDVGTLLRICNHTEGTFGKQCLSGWGQLISFRVVTLNSLTRILWIDSH